MTRASFQFAASSRHLGRTFFLPNTHARWPLQQARLMSVDDDLLAAAGFPGLADRAPDSVLYSAGVRARFGLPQPVRRVRTVATMPG